MSTPYLGYTELRERAERRGRYIEALRELREKYPRGTAANLLDEVIELAKAAVAEEQAIIGECYDQIEKQRESLSYYRERPQTTFEHGERMGRLIISKPAHGWHLGQMEQAFLDARMAGADEDSPLEFGKIDERLEVVLRDRELMLPAAAVMSRPTPLPALPDPTRVPEKSEWNWQLIHKTSAIVFVVLIILTCVGVVIF